VNYGTTEIPRGFPELYLRWGRLFTDDTRVFCPIDNRVRSGYDLFGIPCQPDDSVVVFQMLNDPEFTVLDRGYERTANVGVSGGRGGLTYALNARATGIKSASSCSRSSRSPGTWKNRGGSHPSG